jgi:hypothetical protein
VWDSSTDWGAMSRIWRSACERVLREPGSAQRLRTGTTSAYWHGRLCRLYMLSAAWNAAGGRPIATGARSLHAALAALRAGPCLFSSAFWQALTRQHLTRGFAPAAGLGATRQPAWQARTVG